MDLNDMDAILKRLTENATKARKFFEVETKILSILDFKGLFEVLLEEIRSKFGVPEVWFTIIDDTEILDLVRPLAESKKLKDSMNLIDRETFSKLVGDLSKPVLTNENLKPFYRLLPGKREFSFGSLAVTPIILNSKIIGSLNQADNDSDRFSPGRDTSLLEQLGVKVSLCLSNVFAHEKLKFLAYHDPLTGLLNRRVMEAVLDREFARAKRYTIPLSVAFIDLDYFKEINDKYGHDFGDEFLKHTANGLTHISRNIDIIARFAGDEFVVILPETDKAHAAGLMERVESYFNENPLVIEEEGENLELFVRLSCGVASMDDLEDDFKKDESDNDKNGESKINSALLLKKADEALYEVKKTRRSR